MHGRSLHVALPLAGRNLRADWRRLLTGVIGIGLALMLVLLLEGLWQGVQAGATLYPDHVGADLFVTQPGVANFAGETSTIPRRTLELVRQTPGVAWAAAVRGQFMVFDLHNEKVAAYVVGADPGQPGGPWRLATGRVAGADSEVVVDQALAHRHGLHVGDDLAIADQSFRIVGLSAGTSATMTGFIFMTHAATDALLRAPDTTSYVLIGTATPADVTARLTARGLNVLSRATLAANDRELTTGIFGSPIAVMTGVAFVAGTLVVALTTYAAAMERRREYGIVKALGATGRQLLTVVLSQALLLALIGTLVGGIFFLGVRTLLRDLRPQFSVVLTTMLVLRAVAAALAMAVLASVLPAWRLAATEPAVVYRGSS
jgi:putative ABC transport system permease protein